MNLQELANVVKKAAEAVHKNEKFMVATLASRAEKAAERYPYDTSIGTAYQILSKMAETKAFISRVELNGLYDKIQTHNTKLGEVFADELDRGELLKGPQFYQRTDNEAQAPVNDFEMVADPVLANALSAAFDGSKEYKLYSNSDAKKAESICNASLMELGLAPRSISVFAGQEDLILCQATYETPKGQSKVLIPVEMKQGSALFPTVFLGKDSFVDLKEELLRDHLLSTAGKSYTVNGEHLLKVLSAAKGSVKKSSSIVEMAVAKLKLDKMGEGFFDSNSVIGMKIAEPSKFVEDPKVERHQEHFDFEKRVTSADGAARFIHSDRAVTAGRDMLIRKMAQFGYPNAQVKVANCNENQIHYAIGVGVNAGMMAPVEVVGNTVLPPKVVIASGKVKAFSQAGVKELVQETAPDLRAIATSSMSAGLKPTELVQQVRDAVAEGNLLKAEDAINVLGEVDKHAQKVAIAILLQGLSDPMGTDGNEVGNFYGYNKSEVNRIASQEVFDTPVFNTYNVFFPEE